MISDQETKEILFPLFFIGGLAIGLFLNMNQFNAVYRVILTTFAALQLFTFFVVDRKKISRYECLFVFMNASLLGGLIVGFPRFAFIDGYFANNTQE